MTARLYVLGGRDLGRSFELREEALLGRGPECDLRLRDPSVSRRHARIVFEAEAWFVEDLGSRNGVHKNGARIERSELADHDEIVLGELPLRFRTEDGAEPPPLSRPSEPTEPAEPDLARSPGIEELGEEIHLGEAPGIADLPQRSRTRSRPTEPVPTALGAGSERAALRRMSSDGGFLSGDLAQRPLWVRTIVWLLALGLGAGIFFLAFRSVQALRETS